MLCSECGRATISWNPTNLHTGYLWRSWTNTDLLLSFWFPAFEGRACPCLRSLKVLAPGNRASLCCCLTGTSMQSSESSLREWLQKPTQKCAMVTGQCLDCFYDSVHRLRWGIEARVQTCDSFLSFRKCTNEHCVSVQYHSFKKWKSVCLSLIFIWTICSIRVCWLYRETVLTWSAWPNDSTLMSSTCSTAQRTWVWSGHSSNSEPIYR